MFYQGIRNCFVEGQILTMNVSILGFDLGSMLHFLTQHLWNYDSKLMCFVAFFSQYLIQFNIALSGANYQQRNYFTTIIKPIFFTVKRTCNPSNVSSDWRCEMAEDHASHQTQSYHKCSLRNYQVITKICSTAYQDPVLCLALDNIQFELECQEAASLINILTTWSILWSSVHSVHHQNLARGRDEVRVGHGQARARHIKL